jgi:hypothetical protein
MEYGIREPMELGSNPERLLTSLYRGDGFPTADRNALDGGNDHEQHGPHETQFELFAMALS